MSPDPATERGQRSTDAIVRYLRGVQRTRHLVFALMTAAVLVTSPAEAYVRTKPPGSSKFAQWSDPRITLLVDTSQIPSQIDRTQFLKSTLNAAALWTGRREITKLRFYIHESDRSEVGALRDGRNTIVFQTQNWCRGGRRRPGPCYARRSAAFTTIHFGRTKPELHYVPIEETDIELNAVDFAWHRTDQLSPDLVGILVHELGHVLGLDHTCRPRNPPWHRTRRQATTHPLVYGTFTACCHGTRL